MGRKIILGISAYFHDSAAVLLIDGITVAAAQEERFSRLKHDSEFPSNAVNYVIEESGIATSDIDAVVFYEKPLLKFERILETFHAFAPFGLQQFLKAIPVWIKKKLFLKKLLLKELSNLGISQSNLLFSEHHLSHAASAFFPSPFKESAILTIDGVGEWATCSISIAKGNDIKVLKELRFPHSVGLLYSAFTYYLGFRVNNGEYKLMGLASYGNPKSEKTKFFINQICSNLVTVKEDGSIALNMIYFDFTSGLKMTKNKKWEKLFGLKRRESEAEINKDHMALACAIQHVTESIVLRLVSTAKKITGSKNLVLAGGVALNCVANSKVLKSKIFDNLWVQPSAGDAGGALGAALAVHHIYFENEKLEKGIMTHNYLGPDYSNEQISKVLTRFNAPNTYFKDFDKLTHHICDKISQGKVVGWFQGRMEFGPRALGNRSILANPLNAETQKKLNLKIKFREAFRPFAPSVLEEDCNLYFETGFKSPYMLYVDNVKEAIRLPEPHDYHEWTLFKRLYHLRSKFPAITHIDYSARIQTVNKDTNPRFWKLLSKMKEVTGDGVLVNTSFNVRGEPIVCTPEDAYKCFMKTNMDYLVLGNYVLEKEKQ